ncbi:MAG: ABC transporter permease [Actinomycetota bacterium]
MGHSGRDRPPGRAALGRPGWTEVGGTGRLLGGTAPGGTGPALAVPVTSAGRAGYGRGWGDVWRRFRRDRTAMAGLVFIGLVVVAAALAPLVTPADPLSVPRGSRGLSPPSLDHWFGTDVLGRDLFTRVVYGARVSLAIAGLAVAIACAIALLVGTAAGYLGGTPAAVLMRTTDVFLSFPVLLAALVVITVAGRGPLTIVAVLALLGWMPMARLLRAGVLAEKGAAYVEAARAAGGSHWRLAVHHILPNAIGPVVVYATIFLGTAVLSEAGLSFLGVGVMPPTPSWGAMVAEGRSVLTTNPHVVLFPAGAIALTVLAFVFVGDGLRDALDPRDR